MNSSLLWCLALFLAIIQRCHLRPPPCKKGKFYEESVFDYFNCSHCLEQPHYRNCEICCSSSSTLTPTSALSTQTESLLISQTTPNRLPSSKAPAPAAVEKSDPPDREVVWKRVLFAIIAFLVGFLSIAVTVGLVMLVVKCFMKTKKSRSIRWSAEVRPPHQETQSSLKTSAAFVVGYLAREATETPTG